SALDRPGQFAVGGREDVPDSARGVLAGRDVERFCVGGHLARVDARFQFHVPQGFFLNQIPGQHRAVAGAVDGPVAAVHDVHDVGGGGHAHAPDLVFVLFHRDRLDEPEFVVHVVHGGGAILKHVLEVRERRRGHDRALGGGGRCGGAGFVRGG